MIREDLWAAMGPLVRRAKRHRGGQPPAPPERMSFEALLYPARTGVPLRDLPAEFGAWDAVYDRSRRRIACGAMARRFEAMTADPQFGEARRVLVDSTTVRAHRHAPQCAESEAARAAARRCGRGWAQPRAG